MAEAYRVIAQAAPAAAIDTTLYTVPAATAVVVSTLSVCNTSGATGSFRIAVRPAGVALATQHYTYYDAQIGPNVTVTLTIGMTLAATDVLTIRSSVAGLAFTAFGVVIT